MSKNKSNNSVKPKKHKKYNVVGKNNNKASKEKKQNTEFEDIFIETDNTNVEDISNDEVVEKNEKNEKIDVNENIEKDNIDEINIAEVEENKIDDLEDGNESKENEDTIIDNTSEVMSDENIEVEKEVKSTSLRSSEKKHFFILLFKLIGVCIRNVFISIYNSIKYVFLRISNFFEDRAEDLDRKIREINDEQVIKNQKRMLDYEKYNSIRIYKDLERAEKYRNRANNRVNTEKYFEDKIEREKINNRILVNKAEEDAREAKEVKEKERSINLFNENKRKSRIEKKKNEILELRRKRKEERQKLKEEKDKIEGENTTEQNLDVGSNLSDETDSIIKSLEKQFKLKKEETNEDKENIYDDLFEEFGHEDDFDDVENDPDLPDLDEIIKKADKGEEIKNVNYNVNYKEKNEDRIDEPYEKFEKENDVREVDEKLKSEILRLIDVPESETKDDFISEIEIPSTLRRDSKDLDIVDVKDNNVNEEKVIEDIESDNEKTENKSQKSYIEELLDENSDMKTIGDFLGDEQDEKNDKSEKENDKKDKESDPTINIFAALKNANTKKKDNIKNDSVNQNNKINSKVRISDNQDGFENLKLKSKNNQGNYYDAEKLNIGTWKNAEEDNDDKGILDNKKEKINVNENEQVNVKEKNTNNNIENQDDFVEDYLRYKNPYEAYGKYIKNPEPEKKIEESNVKTSKYETNVVIDNKIIEDLKENKDLSQEDKSKNYDKKKTKTKSKLKSSEKDNNKQNQKSKFRRLLKPSKKQTTNYFDEDLYTNKFIKNIIDIDDSYPKDIEKRNNISFKDDLEKTNNNSEDLKDSLDIKDTRNIKDIKNDKQNDELLEKIEKERYINEYIKGNNDNISLKKDNDNLINDNTENNDTKVKILNVEEVNKDEIVVNAYINNDNDNVSYQSNNYYDDILNTDSSNTGTDLIDNKPIHHFNVNEETKKKVEERRERKISKNEELQRKSYDEFADEKVSFGDMIKDVVSGINSTISEIPANLKKKRESRNRIKRNQIYSTSYNRKGKRR